MGIRLCYNNIGAIKENRRRRRHGRKNMGIFSKKDCSFCGAQSGLLSNRKLADGNICKDCRARLSPFYDLTNKDTVANIAAQLEYRQRNMAELDSFRPTVAAGDRGKVFIDMDSGKFTFATERELREGNPDLFDLSGLHSCTFYAKETIFKGDENESDRFDYDFYLKVSVDHPFVRNFSYRYNAQSVSNRRNRIRESEIRKIYLGQKEIKSGFSALLSGVDKRATENYLNLYAAGQDMIDALTGAAAAFRTGQGYPQPAYRQPVASAYQPPAYEQSAPAAREVNFCPNCGARVSGGAFCPQCGTRLG